MFSKVIPQGHCVVVERFGKPVRVAQSGLRFFLPGLDKLKDVRNIWNDQTNKFGIFIELTEQICDTGSRECFTKDNVKLIVDCVYRWRVTDPIKAIYEVDELHKSLKEAVLGEIRSFIGKSELNTVLASRSRISENVVAADPSAHAEGCARRDDRRDQGRKGNASRHRRKGHVPLERRRALARRQPARRRGGRSAC